MSERRVEINMTGHGLGEVSIDGVKFPRVKSVEFRAALDCANEVKLTFIADTITMTGDAEVTIGEGVVE